MYESFFGLQEKPFSLLPDPSFFYLSKIHREALTLVEYGLYNQSGFTVLTGEIGSGKTTLMRYLLDKLDQDMTVGLISHTHESLGQIMDWVCVAFDLKVPPGDRIAQHQTFVNFLLHEYGKGKNVLLIIDEAQNLGLEKLEEIRLLSNINAGKDLVFQLLLLGQPQLRQQLRQPVLEQFVQRISASYHLGRLNAEETFYYIRHRLKIAGGDKGIFTPDACHAVFHYSQGIPRIINLICETALVYAYGAGEKRITGNTIDNFIKADASHLLFAINGEERTPLPEYDAFPPGASEIESEEDETAAARPPEEEPTPVAPARPDSSASPAPAVSPAGQEDGRETQIVPPAPIVALDASQPRMLLDDEANVAPRLHTPTDLVERDEPRDLRDPNRDSGEEEPETSSAKLIQSGGPRKSWTGEILAVAAGLLMGIGLVGWYIQHEKGDPSPSEHETVERTTETPRPTPSPVADPDSGLARASESDNGGLSAPPVAADGPTDANQDQSSTPAAGPATLIQSEASDPISDSALSAQPMPAIPETDPADTAAVQTSAAIDPGLPSNGERPSPEPIDLDPETEIGRLQPAGQAEDIEEAEEEEGMRGIERRLADLPVTVERLGPGRIRVDFSRLIQFQDGSTELDTEARALLDQFAIILAETDSLRARVVAHTDSKGLIANNQILSAKRAAAVARFIEREGLPGSRIDHEGKGKSELKFTPEQEKALGPWINRRIEIDLIETP